MHRVGLATMFALTTCGSVLAVGRETTAIAGGNAPTDGGLDGPSTAQPCALTIAGAVSSATSCNLWYSVQYLNDAGAVSPSPRLTITSHAGASHARLWLTVSGTPAVGRQTAFVMEAEVDDPMGSWAVACSANQCRLELTSVRKTTAPDGGTVYDWHGTFSAQLAFVRYKGAVLGPLTLSGTF